MCVARNLTIRLLCYTAQTKEICLRDNTTKQRQRSGPDSLFVQHRRKIMCNVRSQQKGISVTTCAQKKISIPPRNR